MLTASMEPSIGRGSLVVIVPTVHPVSVGAVVAFVDPFDRRRVLAHRIIEVVHSSAGHVNYRTKGDANPREDPRPIPEREVMGIVRFRVPGIGRALQFLKTPVGIALAVGPPVLGLAVERVLTRRRRREWVPPPLGPAVYTVVPALVIAHRSLRLVDTSRHNR